MACNAARSRRCQDSYSVFDVAFRDDEPHTAGEIERIGAARIVCLDERWDAPATESAAWATSAAIAVGKDARHDHHDFPMTFTGIPTCAKLYVHRATVKDWRTHPCDAG